VRPIDIAESLDDFATFGVRAFTTSRDAGTFGLHSNEPTIDVMRRWSALRETLSSGGPRLATSTQVHGSRVVVHGSEWDGWLRVDAADGHASTHRGTAMAVTIADCVPVFIAHPSGAAAVLHSGWRGTTSRIVERGIEALAHRGIATSELRIHLGPAICGGCYEVSADVYTQLTGRSTANPTTVDLRALIADHARAAGVRHITASPLCTRCDNGRLYSHRAGDEGRQLAVILAEI
jgi:purine-nucleoside/S-methyl-5'-thioadenosine phosphorylase / adenosine deaminase